MILRLAFRSLAVRPVRTLLLVCGFGFGVAVMAILLGVGEVILDQSRSPALQGGGDLVVSGRFGAVDNARFLLSGVLHRGALGTRIAAASPFKRSTMYLVTGDGAHPVAVRAGVPSLERAVGDAETANVTVWTDRESDRRWASPDAGDVLRRMDRFHPVPDVPEFASSWAEWLYFNGRTADGRVRFYLTFLVGPATAMGARTATVRLQLMRDGREDNFSSESRGALVDPARVLADAPDLEIEGSRVRLEGTRYSMALRLVGEDARRRRLTGTLTLDAQPGRSLPPTVMHGARGWLSGYVVPVLSGPMRGSLQIDGEPVVLENVTGYHDHNWGFWQDVRWQWGQVAHDDLSFVFGRVFPPASVADADRVPGFLGVMGPDGPVAVSTDVSIVEHDADGRPQRVDIAARGSALDLHLALGVDQAVRTSRATMMSDFLQLAGVYHVAGEAAGRRIDFTARGAAETFRPSATR